jgi:hypothetical protein
VAVLRCWEAATGIALRTRRSRRPRPQQQPEMLLYDGERGGSEQGGREAVSLVSAMSERSKGDVELPPPAVRPRVCG